MQKKPPHSTVNGSLIGIPKPTKEQRLRERIERLKQKIKVKKEPRLSVLKKTAQKIVNAYVRQRDLEEPCISCQKPKLKEAGHFWPQGSNGALRYHLDNINGQCDSCNRYKHGNLLEYRINLIKKIGEERVKWLDDHHNDIKKWTREELLEIISKYKIK